MSLFVLMSSSNIHVCLLNLREKNTQQGYVKNETKILQKIFSLSLIVVVVASAIKWFVRLRCTHLRYSCLLLRLLYCMYVEKQQVETERKIIQQNFISLRWSVEQYKHTRARFTKSQSRIVCYLYKKSEEFYTKQKNYIFFPTEK